MKRWSLVVGLVLIVSLLVASQAMAAPSVSVKAGTLVGLVGLEVGFPVSDHFSIIGQGGWTPYGYYGSASIGVRWYMTTTGWRPFLAAYGGVYIDYPYVEPFVAATAGLEYLSKTGFRFAAEIGPGYTPYHGFYPACGVSIGYQF